MRLHPATVLALWGAGIAALPGFGVPALAAASFALAALLVEPARRARFRLLLRRSRWLLVAIAVVYAFTTPGRLLWPGLAASPSLEGLQAGAMQAWRLSLVLASLACVLTHLGRDGTLAGLYTLLRPLAGLGVPADRFAVRLALVLELADSAPRPRLSMRQLAGLWDAPPVPARDTVTLTLPAFTWRDGLALSLGLLALVSLR